MVAFQCVSKEVTEQRDVTEEWDFIYLVTGDLFVDTTEYHGVTIVDQNLCLYFTTRPPKPVLSVRTPLP